MSVTVYPDKQFINNLKTPLTDSEKSVADQLASILEKIEGREFVLHQQVNLNGNKPDILIIERPTDDSLGGIWIVEVKDWTLKNYITDDAKYWKFKKNNHEITSPDFQVDKYKKDFFYTFFLEFTFEYFKNKSISNLIKTAVYFYGSNPSIIQNKFLRMQKTKFS
ncbi:MAG: NERD domain-containing protein [Bacilli bacterium]|nr:NERD domain-containing protein [Bacilli bacterium]